VIGSVIIGISVVLGCFIISRAPRFERTGASELIETRSGSTYELKGTKQPGQPFYKVVPGPSSRGIHVEPQYRN
jgi:hypothetical protein